MSIICLDLFLELVELLVFLLPAGLIVILSVVGELVDLERIVEVLRDLSPPFKTLDVAGADLEALVGHAGRLLSCCCLHFY